MIVFASSKMLSPERLVSYASLQVFFLWFQPIPKNIGQLEWIIPIIPSTWEQAEADER